MFTVSTHFSLRFKLIVATILAVWGSASINSIYVTSREGERAENSIREKAISVGNYIVFISTPAMVFDDPQALNESLSALSNDPDLSYVMFTDTAGSILASISKQMPLPENRELVEETKVRFEEQYVHVVIPVQDQGDTLGMFYLGLSMQRQVQQIQEDVNRAFAFNIVMALFITLVMMLFFRRVIFRPVSHLAASTKLISTGNFDIQKSISQIQSKDELGQLAHSFQEMATSISEKNCEIVTQNETLKEREQSLQKINDFLSSYLPKQFVHSVLTQGEEGSITMPKRERLTVFFSDLQGFTGLTDQLDPENLFTMLNEYQSAMNQIVLKYDGTLDKYMGDGLMVFFGAPQSRGEQEDALRCCLMAMEMQNAMSDLQKTWFYKGIEASLDLRIGVHTGFSAVGSFGTESRLDYTAIGPVVNIASRLEAACPPKYVKISHQTWANIHSFIHTEEVEAIVPKGLNRTMKTYLLGTIRSDLLTLLKQHNFSNELQTLCQNSIELKTLHAIPN